MKQSSVINSFFEIYEYEENLSSFKNYYDSLRLWVKKNEGYFGQKLQRDPELRMLLDLEVDKYLVEDPELNLDMELKRMQYINIIKKDKIGTLLMFINGSLWDMVTLRSIENCPHCGDGDLRYLNINYKENGKGKVILECQVCGHAINVDGSEVEETITEYLPATKDDLKAAGVVEYSDNFFERCN